MLPRLLGNETMQAQECCRKGEGFRRMVTGSELFSYLTCICPDTATFLLLCISSLVEKITLQTWERPLSWHAKCSISVSVRDQKRLHA